MSYILDALRKADAERERDPARGIHAQPLAGVPAPERRGRGLPLAAGAAAGLLLVGAFVYLSRPAPATSVALAPVNASAAPKGAPPATVPAVVPVANAVLPPAPPPAPRPTPRAEARTVATASAQPAPALAVAKVPMAAPAGQPAAGAPSAVPTGAMAPAAAGSGAVLKASPAAADRVLALSELPADVRGALPKLAISGGVHSDNAAQRMLIVGGQVLREGSEVAPGVMLEQIRARSAVLRFRDHRFSIVY